MPVGAIVHRIFLNLARDANLLQRTGEAPSGVETVLEFQSLKGETSAHIDESVCWRPVSCAICIQADRESPMLRLGNCMKKRARRLCSHSF